MATGICLFLIALCLQSAVASGRLVGGWKSRDCNDKSIQEVARYALTEYTEASNSPNVLMLIRVISAASQVVAGTKYNITIEIGETSCKTAVSEDSQPCDPETSEINRVNSVISVSMNDGDTKIHLYFYRPGKVMGKLQKAGTQ